MSVRKKNSRWLGKKLLQELNELVAHDQIAVDLSELALSRGYVGDGPTAIVELRNDHCRHVRSLLLLMESLGGSATDAFRVIVGRTLLPDECSLIEALYLNSVRAHGLYHRLLGRQRGVPLRLRGVLAGNLANERFHAVWLERRLLALRAAAARTSDWRVSQ
jgi:hypothetical protein